MTKTKVKFSKQNADFIGELREKVKEYFGKKNMNKYGNTNLIVKSGFMFSLYIVPYFFMVLGLVDSLSAILLCWLIMGFGKAGIGMGVMHDANHGSFSQSTRLNNLLGKSLYLLGGFPPNWKYQHNTMHHGYTNIDGHDEDIDPAGILRFSPHKPLKKIHRYQHWYAWFFYGLMTLTWAIDKDFKQLSGYKKNGVKLSGNKKYTQMFTDLIIAKLLYFTAFIVIPIIVLPIAWYWVLLFFFAMHFVSGFILGIVFQTAHVMPTSIYPLPDENGNVDNNWAIHQLMTTSDYSPKSWAFSWFIGGLNYQIEHHLFPNISHVHYRKLSKLVKETAHKYNLPYNVQDNFIVAIINHLKMLKSLGQLNTNVSIKSSAQIAVN
jgi:linoleoyl-CoA desaturase